MKNVKEVKISKSISIGNSKKKFTLIAGPCVIESEKMTLFVATELKKITEDLGIDFIFKSSFDKANRSSINSHRGVGIERGLEILKLVKETLNIPVITDVHESWQCEKVADVVDIIQIPAFLCRQTDLLIAAAKTGKVINIKKGQFLAPWDMKNIIEKIKEFNNNILLCERGTTFGYNQLIVDMASLYEMRKFGYPIVFDATHSVQKPGGQGKTTGGNREHIPILMRAALAVGVDAIFAEVHPDPEKALSDGPNQLNLKDVREILIKAIKVDETIRGFGNNV